MYDSITVFCPNCKEKTPTVFVERDSKTQKSKARFICNVCKCSLLVSKHKPGEYTISVKELGHYTN